MFVYILLCLLIIVLAVYSCLEHTNPDTFHSYHQCSSPCHTLGEHNCCQCPNCSWFINRNYSGRCIRRGTGPDSCLNRQQQQYVPSHPLVYNEIRTPWYHPRNLFYWQNRNRPEDSCLVKDSWGRCIEPASGTVPLRHHMHHRRNRRRRRRRRWR